MAKIFKPSDETIDFVEQHFAETGLERFITLKVIGVSKQSQVFNVSKANGLIEYIGNLDDAIVVSVYEEAFDRLDDNTKTLLIRDALAQVSFDDEKEKLIVSKPQISVTVGGRQTYGERLIDAVETSIHVIDAIEEEIKERKAAEKEAKKRKNK